MKSIFVFELNGQVFDILNKHGVFDFDGDVVITKDGHREEICPLSDEGDFEGARREILALGLGDEPGLFTKEEIISRNNVAGEAFDVMRGEK